MGQAFVIRAFDGCAGNMLRRHRTSHR